MELDLGMVACEVRVKSGFHRYSLMSKEMPNTYDLENRPICDIPRAFLKSRLYWLDHDEKNYKPCLIHGVRIQVLRLDSLERRSDIPKARNDI